MESNNKVFMNAVMNDDLFFTIYDYLRFHPQVARENYHVLTIDDLNNLSVEDWKDAAEDTIYWLEHDQLPKVYVLGKDDDSPGMNSWGTLYYQTLAYMERVFPKYQYKSTRQMDLGELVKVCRECIENMKDLMDEIRETTYDDLNDL